MDEATRLYLERVYLEFGAGDFAILFEGGERHLCKISMMQRVSAYSGPGWNIVITIDGGRKIRNPAIKRPAPEDLADPKLVADPAALVLARHEIERQETIRRCNDILRAKRDAGQNGACRQGGTRLENDLRQQNCGRRSRPGPMPAAFFTHSGKPIPNMRLAGRLTEATDWTTGRRMQALYARANSN